MNPLSFDALFDRVIAEWPSCIAVNVEYTAAGDGPARYVVSGMGELRDVLSEAHINQRNEIISRTLHHAIYGRLHALAPDVERLEPYKLSRRVVRGLFEQRLRSARQRADDLGWTPEDLALVDAYFAANPVERLLAAE